MNFREYWLKAKIPDLDRMSAKHCEILRLVANQAFNAGRTEMRREIREQDYEKKYGRLHTNQKATSARSESSC